MKFPFLVCGVFLLFAICSATSSFAQSELITVNFNNTPFATAVAEVESKSKIKFYYSEADVKALTVTFQLNDSPLRYILDKMIENSGLHYAVDPEGNVFITKVEVVTTLAGQERLQAAVARAAKGNESAAPENKVYEIGKRGTSQAPFTLSGFIRNPNGDAVGDASITVEKQNRGTNAGGNGSYTITLPAGRSRLIIRSVGMQDAHRTVNMMGDGTLNIEMEVEVKQLKEVLVEADETSNIRSAKLGVEKLNMTTIKNIPAVFGEADILRVILTLPGVKSVGEASTGFNVRGGATDQNLILFNDATIYNPSHFFGFFSAFNPEIIQDVELYKSSMPAKYGGRLASVLNITGKKGSNEKIQGSAGIGVLTSRLNLEGPIIKNKLNFIAGARTTYSNWLFKFLPEGSGYKNSKASFYDVNVILSHEVNKNNDYTITGYVSSDESNLNTDTTFTYNNKNISLRWNHTFNNNFTSTFVVGHDHYAYGNSSDADPTQAYDLSFAIDQSNLKALFTYSPNLKHSVEFGFNSLYYQITPGSLIPKPGSLLTPRPVQNEQALESALFIEERYQLSKAISINAGIRYSFFNFLGPKNVNQYTAGVPRTEDSKLDSISYKKGDVINTYHGAEFRLSGRYAISDNFSVKAGYTTVRQYIHMLSNTLAISPTDIWKLSDPNIKPQISQQISVGVYKDVFENQLEISVEGYTKKIQNYLDYKSGAVLVANPAIETEVFTTRGKAYGIETMIKKPKGNFNGWISYTYSRILLRVDDPISGETINKGNYYPASYDKPHDVTFVGNQKISRRFSISMNLMYSTGRPVTIPIGVFYYGGSPKTLYSSRNSYRIPDYFRADLSLNIEGNHKIRQIAHNSWTIGVYNLTARKNPYSVYYTSENGVIKGYKLSIFGAAIPFINYNIRF
jgi:hypothetical protein